MAEHHNLPGIASAATAVALAHVGAGTSSIKIGAGGIMLPNHAPLVIAEQFGTLAALHPGASSWVWAGHPARIKSPTAPCAEISTAMSTSFRAMSSS